MMPRNHEEERIHQLVVMGCKRLVSEGMLDNIVEHLKQRIFRRIDGSNGEWETDVFIQKNLLEGVKEVASMIRSLSQEYVDKT